MPHAPKIDAEQLGAVIDAVTAVQAAMFTALASDGQIDAMHRLLDRMRKGFEQQHSDPLNLLRAQVLESTAATLQGLKLLRPEPDRSGVQ